MKAKKEKKYRNSSLSLSAFSFSCVLSLLSFYFRHCHGIEREREAGSEKERPEVAVEKANKFCAICRQTNRRQSALGSQAWTVSDITVPHTETAHKTHCSMTYISLGTAQGIDTNRLNFHCRPHSASNSKTKLAKLTHTFTNLGNQLWKYTTLFNRRLSYRLAASQLIVNLSK